MLKETFTSRLLSLYHTLGKCTWPSIISCTWPLVLGRRVSSLAKPWEKNPLNVRSSEEMTRFHFLEISQILRELSLRLEWIHVVAYVLRCFAKEFSAKFILWLHEEFAFKIACNVCKMMPMKLWFCKCWVAVMQFWGQRLSAVEQKPIFRLILT